MPNIASVLKQEIARIARKEVRSEIDALKQTMTGQRTQLVQLRRELKDTQAQLQRLAKSGTANAPSRTRGRSASDSANASAANDRASDGQRLRFNAKGLASNRKRLGLSAEDFGKLVGVTGQSIYAWESGRSQPRARQLAAIAQLRGIGKKEVAKRLGAA